MVAGPYQLAFETSSRVGSVSLGCGACLLASRQWTTGRGQPRDLLVVVDELCREQGVTPGALSELYVSLGPGSFTGLRIAVAAAKMLALTLGVKLVGVPTLDVLAEVAPSAEALRAIADPGPQAVLLTALNVKGDSAWCRPWRWTRDHWEPAGDAALRALAGWHDPCWLLAEVVPEGLANTIATLPVELAQPDSASVYRLGRRRAAAGRFDAARDLLPIYARQPEAVRLWQQRHAAVRPTERTLSS